MGGPWNQAQARPAAAFAPLPALLDLIRHRRYGAEYQPIVSIETSAVVGYEALARFADAGGAPVAPRAVFEALHANPLSLFQVEHDMKRLQIEHAPPGCALFLNLDPHAFSVGGSGEGENPLLALFASRADVVVEIIENTSVSDAQKGGAMLDAFLAREVPLALDDIGATGTLIALEVMAAVDYLKFDRAWLRRADDRKALAMIKAMIGYAREAGKQTVMEGIESRADLDIAHGLGIDYAQGYLFRERFLQVEPAAGN
jgi:EAL domain-containing protein (putative c-di-GMP-specific phosphodiesterase class I)